MESDVQSRVINLNNTEFHTFAVNNCDTCLDLFSFEQTLRRIVIIPTGSTVTNPDIFREILILGESCKYHIL
jgi:hypothetical protein